MRLFLVNSEYFCGTKTDRDLKVHIYGPLVRLRQ
jgi:hypothetical protein